MPTPLPTITHLIDELDAFGKPSVGYYAVGYRSYGRTETLRVTKRDGGHIDRLGPNGWHHLINLQWSSASDEEAITTLAIPILWNLPAPNEKEVS